MGETTGWQPISTAPKDGSSVLLWSPMWEMSWGIQIGQFGGIYWHTAEGEVAENEPDFDPEAEVGDDFDPDDDRNFGPTHWMPLPEPPTT